MASLIKQEELRDISLLSELEGPELESLRAVLREKRVPKGSFIVYADDPAPSLLFLAEGKVKITLISDEGKEIVLAQLEDGDFFGEMALLTGADRSANVIAQTDCKLFVLAERDFKEHILRSSGLALAMMRELATRLRRASEKIGDLALYDVYRRVARTLKSLSKEELDESSRVISERPTHQELASMVGTSREMVTRALKGLEEDGCIVIQGKRIVIHSLPR